jgi:lipid-A-disaccharide synthase-like uncharacterized protein
MNSPDEVRIVVYLEQLWRSLDWWAAVGFGGQFMFFSRFLLQWLHSERVGRSEIPVGFWFLSLAGGTITLIYAIHIANAVFILGQAVGLLVYIRNVMLIARNRPSSKPRLAQPV